MPKIPPVFRSLLRNPGLTSSAALALALGIGANTALFTVISSLVLHPYPIPDPNRLFVIQEREPHGAWPGIAPADYFDLTSRSTVFTALGAWGGEFSTLADAGATDQVWSASVTEHLFRLLGSRPVIGRSFLPEDFTASAPATAMLSYREWMSRFSGNPAILGHTVAVDDTPRTIIGVMPSGFILPGFRRSDVFLPYRPKPDDRADRGYRHLFVCGEVKAGVSLGQANADLQALTRQLRANWPPDSQRREIYAKSFRDYISQDNRAALLTLLGASAFVLLIATANVTSLLLARTVVRRHEIAVRRALGASTIDIARQSLSESFAVALFGGIVGLPVAAIGTTVLLRFIPADSPIAGLENVHADLGVFAFALALTLTVAFLLGLIPALSASHTSLNEALHQAERSVTLGRGGRRLLRSLTAVEVALALVLTSGAALMISSLERLLNTDRGFQAQRVLTIEAPALGQRFQNEARQKQVYADLVQRVQAIPGVEAAAFVGTLPLAGGQFMLEISVEGHTGRGAFEQTFPVSPAYFRVMGIRLIEGRLFTNSDGNTGPTPIIVNQTFARKYWLGESAIGKRLREVDSHGTPPWQVVIGVVGDTRNNSLSEPPHAALYCHYQRYIGVPFVATVVARAHGDPSGLAGSLRQAVIATDPALPISKIESMDQVVEESLWKNRLSTALFTLFAALALILAAIGIYGTLSYVVQQSLAEAGIRLALGASPARILRFTLRGAMFPALAGTVIGLLGSLLLTRLLQDYLYQVTATNPWTLAASAAILLAVAFLAGILPARRAAFVDPMSVLRHE